MSVRKSDLEKILKEWDTIKHKLKKLQSRDEDIKSFINSYMNSRSSNKTETRSYIVVRKKNTKQIIGRTDVPVHIWNKYYRTVKYTTLNLTKL